MGKTRYAPSTRRFAEVPHQPAVYVVELSTGALKVGATTSARARMMSLANELRRNFQAEILRFHVTPKATPKAAYETETTVVKSLSEIAEVIPGRREHFCGVAYEVACALADTAIGQPYRQPYRYQKRIPSQIT